MLFLFRWVSMHWPYVQFFLAWYISLRILPPVSLFLSSLSCCWCFCLLVLCVNYTAQDLSNISSTYNLTPSGFESFIRPFSLLLKIFIYKWWSPMCAPVKLRNLALLTLKWNRQSDNGDSHLGCAAPTFMLVCECMEWSWTLGCCI